MVVKYLRYGLGIDVSKKYFHSTFCAVLEGDQIKVLKSKRFLNTIAGFQAYEEWLKKQMKSNVLPLRILMEATGVYHENLLYFLYERGYAVVLETGRRVKRYLEVIGYKSKNDKLDGKGMAEMACKGFGNLWKPISKHIIKVRATLRLRKSLIQTRVRFSNQLHAQQHSKHKVKQVISSLNRMIKTINKEIERVEHQAYELAQKDTELMEKINMIVDSVKGLGLLTVLTVVAETNGFHDFISSKQVVSYAGFDIVENQSGKHKGITRISKKGNTHIRTILYMSSLGVIRCKTLPFYNLYLRLIKRNGNIKKKAMVAVQRKLLVLIYTLWKKNQPFDLKYYTDGNQQLLQLANK